MPVTAILAAIGGGINRPTLDYTISADTTAVGDLNTFLNANVGGYLGINGYSIINLTINSGVKIGGSSNGLSISGFPAYTTINVINNGTIWGPGGTGGSASYGSFAQAGSAGGTALNVSGSQGTINVTNNGSILAPGGGGGAAYGTHSVTTKAGTTTFTYTAGGGGGQGYPAGSGGSATGAADGNAPGSAGSFTAAGAGGTNGDATAGAGGATNTAGAAASLGTGGATAGGGAAGACVVGNSFITWLAFGTRTGSIS